MIYGPAVRVRVDRVGVASHRAWVPVRAMMHVCLRARACGPCGEASGRPRACERAPLVLACDTQQHLPQGRRSRADANHAAPRVGAAAPSPGSAHAPA
eukprot:14788284-Alexandrium_andersonii.AAC.1